VSVFLGIAGCACMILVYLVPMIPTIVILACRLGRTLSLSCWFDLYLELCNLFLQLLDVILRCFQLVDELGIVHSQSGNISKANCRGHHQLRDSIYSALHCPFTSVLHHNVSTVEAGLMCSLVCQLKFAMHISELNL
jgi:hypothetical protein